MEHAQINPLFAKPPTAYVGQGQTRQSTSSDKPRQNGRQASSRTKEAIATLGLRYRPTSQTDLEGHAAQLALLVVDLADVPVALLERAIQDWSVRSPYMPKAYDLVQLAKGYLPKPVTQSGGNATDWQTMAERANQDMHTRDNGRKDIHWVADHAGMRLEFKSGAHTKMDRFMEDLERQCATIADVDRAPERWRMIAMERGYLRQMDDRSFIIRERRCSNPAL